MNASIVEAIKQCAQGELMEVLIQKLKIKAQKFKGKEKAFQGLPLHISKELHPANLSICAPYLP